MQQQQNSKRLQQKFFSVSKEGLEFKGEFFQMWNCLYRVEGLDSNTRDTYCYLFSNSDTWGVSIRQLAELLGMRWQIAKDCVEALVKRRMLIFRLCEDGSWGYQATAPTEWDCVFRDRVRRDAVEKKLKTASRGTQLPRPGGRSYRVQADAHPILSKTIQNRRTEPYEGSSAPPPPQAPLDGGPGERKRYSEEEIVAIGRMSGMDQARMTLSIQTPAEVLTGRKLYIRRLLWGTHAALS